MSDKGKYVTRSEYQRVCEENKRLLRDIRAVIEDRFTEKNIEVYRKWSEYFRKNRELKNSITQALGMTIKTTDGVSVKMSDMVWIIAINDDCTKHVPQQEAAIEALNDNEAYFYHSWQNCQDYCNEINNVDIH